MLTRLEDDLNLTVIYNYEIPPDDLTESIGGMGVESTIPYWETETTLSTISTSSYQDGILNIEDLSATTHFVESLTFKDGENYDVGLERERANVVKVTDGSTGNGGIQAAAFFVSALGVAPDPGGDLSGVIGEIRFCEDAIYLCVGLNSWVKAVFEPVVPVSPPPPGGE